MKTLADAVNRINQTLFKLPKLADAIHRADQQLSRADADWNEQDHPRDKSGKFTSGGGGGGAAAQESVAEYKKSLGGKKGTVAKLMQFMLKKGGVTGDEVQKAAADIYSHPEDKANWVQWYYKDMLKKGEDVPQMQVEGHTFSPESTEAVKEYMNGKDKPTAAGLIESMIMKSGKVDEFGNKMSDAPIDDIWRQAKLLFGDKIDISWVHYYHKELKKKSGFNGVPSLNYTKFTPGGPAPATPAPAPPPPPPAQPAPKALTDKYEQLKSVWKNVLPENKAIVDVKSEQISFAFDPKNFQSAEEQKEYVKNIQPITSPTGMGQKSVNDFIAQVKNEYGVGPAPTASLPQGPTKALQDEIFLKSTQAPPLYKELVTKSEGAGGTKFKARVITDTEAIPGDWYAKVTAAYGNGDDAMTQAVDKAMEDYHKATVANFPAAEFKAIKRYQGADYDDMNTYIAGKNPNASAENKKAADLMIKAYNRPESVVPADTPVWRGMKRSLHDITGFTDPQELVGRSFVYDSFTSVSRDRHTARNFGTRTMMKFTVPAGTKGIVMSGQTNFEREIVLGPNTVYRVTKVEQIAGTNNGKNPYGDPASYILHCDYLGEKIS